MVVVEAMSSGLPLVVTKSGGIPEIVNKENAIIINKDKHLVDNMAKSLDFLVTNENKRINMGINGIKLANNFSGQKFYEGFINVIEEFSENNNIV